MSTFLFSGNEGGIPDLFLIKLNDGKWPLKLAFLCEKNTKKWWLIRIHGPAPKNPLAEKTDGDCIDSHICTLRLNLDLTLELLVSPVNVNHCRSRPPCSETFQWRQASGSRHLESRNPARAYGGAAWIPVLGWLPSIKTTIHIQTLINILLNPNIWCKHSQLQ